MKDSRINKLAPKLARQILKDIKKALHEYAVPSNIPMPPGWSTPEYMRLDIMANKLVLKALRGVKIDAP